MYEYKVKEVLRIYDGDTYRLNLDLGFHVSNTIKLRLEGLDTPETYRPKSEAEREHGQEATAFVVSAFNAADQIIVRTRKDPTMTFDRWVGEITLVDKDGDIADLATLLQNAGFEKREAY